MNLLHSWTFSSRKTSPNGCRCGTSSSFSLLEECQGIPIFSISSLPKKERDRILISVLQKGAGIRQLSKLSAVGFSIIRRLKNISNTPSPWYTICQIWIDVFVLCWLFFVYFKNWYMCKLGRLPFSLLKYWFSDLLIGLLAFRFDLLFRGRYVNSKKPEICLQTYGTLRLGEM